MSDSDILGIQLFFAPHAANAVAVGRDTGWLDAPAVCVRHICQGGRCRAAAAAADLSVSTRSGLTVWRSTVPGRQMVTDGPCNGSSLTV
jgi:hypothetical protein